MQRRSVNQFEAAKQSEDAQKARKEAENAHSEKKNALTDAAETKPLVNQLICESAKKHSREASVCLFSFFSISTSIVLRKAAEEATKAAIKAADEVRLLLTCFMKFSCQQAIATAPGHCNCERKSGGSIFEGQKGSTGYGASRGRILTKIGAMELISEKELAFFMFVKRSESTEYNKYQ